MNRNRNRAARPPSGAPPQNSSPINRLDEWSKEFCREADGRNTVEGLRLLGPIEQFADLLLSPHTTGNPGCELAAEQIVCLVEGWRYAAAATNALLSHADNAATHFAYYAELKAAQSLFAWSGIRTKWGSYYYLDRQGTKNSPPYNPNTHTAVWAIWKHWVERPDIQTLMATTIKLHPLVSLDAIVRTVNFARPGQQLRGWGADLVKVSDDHTARNTASYEAAWTRTPLTRMNKSQAEFVRELWELFLGDGQGLAFDSELCTYFVEQAVLLELQKELATPADPTRPLVTAEIIRKRISRTISDNTGAPAEEIFRRLTPLANPRRTFALASATDLGAENVMSRSFFLLRMALLAMKSSLTTTGMPAHASRWISHWLDHAGIWASSSGIEIEDVELDYREAVHDLDTSSTLPTSLWTGENQSRFYRVTRPDACVAWSLMA